MVMSVWDDPFGEEKLAGKTVLFPGGGFRPEVNVALIRERQKKLLPYIEELKQAAAEIVKRYDPLALSAAERELMTVVEYRIPDNPHLLQRFCHSLTDLSVLVPVDRRAGKNSVLDKLAPPAGIENIKGHGHVMELLRLEGIGEKSLPAEVREVCPRLFEFIAFWIRELDGPINRVSCVKRPVQSVMQHFAVSHFRH